MTSRAPFRRLGIAGGLSICGLLACSGSVGSNTTAAGGNAGSGPDREDAGATSQGGGNAHAGSGVSGAVGHSAGAASASGSGEAGGADGVAEAGADGVAEAGTSAVGSGGAGDAGAGFGGAAGSDAGAAGEAGAGPQITLDLQPGAEGKDAQVTTLKGHSDIDNTNYASGTAMVASAWTFSSVPVNMRCFIEFDLSQIPVGAKLDSATLSLFAAPSGPASDPFAGHSTLSGSNDFWVETVSAAWSESSITWANQPKTTWNMWGNGAPQGGVHHVPTTSYAENVSVDVTPLLNAALSDRANYHGFMIHLNSEQYYRNLRFATSDHEQAGLHPKLAVHYRLAP